MARGRKEQIVLIVKLGVQKRNMLFLLLFFVYEKGRTWSETKKGKQ